MEHHIAAYVLLSAELGRATEIAQTAKEQKQVSSVSITTGIYDMMIRVVCKNLDDLHTVTDAIQRIEGVLATSTSVVVKEF